MIAIPNYQVTLVPLVEMEIRWYLSGKYQYKITELSIFKNSLLQKIIIKITLLQDTGHLQVVKTL